MGIWVVCSEVRVKHCVSYAKTWLWLQRKPRDTGPPPIRVCRISLEPHHQTEESKADCCSLGLKTLALPESRCRNTGGTPMVRTQGQQASLTFLYKIHKNLVTTDRSEAGRRNRSTRSHPFQYLHSRAEIFILPHDNCNLEWSYHRRCLRGDSWQFKSKLQWPMVWVRTWHWMPAPDDCL